MPDEEIESRVRTLEVEVGILKAQQLDVKEDIGEIKKGQDKLLWGIISTIVTVLVSIFLNLAKLN